MGRLNYQLQYAISLRELTFEEHYGELESLFMNCNPKHHISFWDSIHLAELNEPNDFEIELWSVTPFIKVYWGGEFPDEEFDIKRVTKSMWKKASHYYRKYQWEQRAKRIEENEEMIHESYHFDEDEFGY
jgi:hypothetical protein